MMKGRLHFIIALTFVSYQSFAQVPGCPSDDLNDSIILSNPVYARTLFHLDHHAHEQMQLSPEDRDDVVYTIPVVVHVIHEGEPVGTGSNISDEQIFSAIEALNNDFRKVPGTNGDGDGVDVGIEFCLAARDPDGNPSTGIERANGTSATNYPDLGIEATSGVGADEGNVKALSTWPREEYVNIWVVNEIENNDAGAGVQGYAYFPVDSPLDGIVVLFNAMGTVGNLKASTMLNRTLTHEMGHYFALYHTFHGTSECGSETSCITGGDKVCDTPVTPVQTNCTSPSCDGTQQVENYMDYTSESCRNMFTEGQKVRMRTTLLTERSSLLTSLGCIPVTANDCGISAIISPAGNSCETTLNPVVTLTNFGSNTLTSCTIYYSIDGVGNSAYPWTGNLASGFSVPVSLPSMTSSTSTHNFISWTASPNGGADQNSSNNQSNGGYTISTGAQANLLIELDYFGEETTWDVTDDSGDILHAGGPYPNNQQGTVINENICPAPGCYTLTFYDSFGDGQSLVHGEFTLVDSNDNVFFSESDDWGAQISNVFCIDNDGSSSPVPCSGDLDANGMINITDLLIMTSSYGCMSGCAGDLDQNGVVNIGDLLLFTSSFGLMCN